MPDWLDEKLAEQAAVDEENRRQREEQELRVRLIRAQLPEFLNSLYEHVRDVLHRYHSCNEHNSDRRIEFEGTQQGRCTVRRAEPISLNVTWEGDPLTAKMQIQRSCGQDEDELLELDIRLDREMKLFIGNELDYYLTVHEFAKYLLMPVLFPELPIEKRHRAV